MFWKFNLLTSHIDTLLDKEDVTLHELLDEDDVLQECKGQNRKLIDFLVKPENMEELVNLVTQEPSDDTDEKIRYKYPNIACELLTADVAQINDKLAGEDGLMGKVYSFLEAEGPLNPLLASFFSKVMGTLITRKSEMMVEFLKSKDDFVGQLLHHLGTSAIMDLLLRLITCIESAECRHDCITWLDKQGMVQKLVAMIDPSCDEEKHCNAAQALCDIIRLGREQMSQLQEKADPDPLLAAVEAQETVSKLLDHMFETERNESVIVNGLCVVRTLLEFKKIGIEGTAEQLTELDAERLAKGINSTLMALTPRLKDINQLLIEPPKQHYSPMPTTVGTFDPPLGNARLQVANLITSLLGTNKHFVNIELVNLGTISILLDLFTKYIWNNFLHTQIECCIATVIANPCTEVEGKSENPLLTQLFTDCKLVQRIVNAWEDNEQQQTRPGGHRRGYMGHLTRIANNLVENMEKGTNTERIKELIQDLPENDREKWNNFVSGTLADMNKQNTVELVGHPLHSSSEDEDADFRDIPFPQDTAMQQAFSDYQLQQMTSNFIDQFGFNEEEFAEQEERVDNPFNEKISSINFDINSTEDNPTAASLFEQACSERMQQFDEADSDEELWEEKEITFSQGGDTRGSTDLQASSTSIERATGSEEDSEGSTDSEEDLLDSPRKITQLPPNPTANSITEKMDIDNSENWANFDDVPMDSTTPVAMETTPVAWANSSSAVSAATTNNENWAKFESSAESKSEEEEWADFASFSSIDSTNRIKTNPRSSSPVAMDTADSTSGRTSAYMISSNSGDGTTKENLSEISHVPDSTSEIGQQSAVQRKEPAKNASENKSATIVDSTTPDDSSNTSKDTPLPVVQNIPNSQNEAKTNQESDSNQECKEEVSQNEQSTSNTVQDKVLSGGDIEKVEDDLGDNFNFLASSGLIKSASSEDKDSTVSGGDAASVAEQAKIEEMRNQAKEAMEQFSQTAGGGGSGATKPNGPV